MKKTPLIITVFAGLLFAGCAQVPSPNRPGVADVPGPAPSAVNDPTKIMAKAAKAETVLKGLVKAEGDAVCKMDSSELAPLYKEAVGIALTAVGLGPGYAAALPAVEEVVAGLCSIKSNSRTVKP